ncbi:MAG: prohibitin family protein, partial [Clostridia bacterium]|nr:prohibitin family protein [Clostridia bacterium]
RIVKLDVNTEAFSKDLQTITTVVAVNYHVGKENSQTVYKNVGLNFEEVLITPAVNEVLKAVTAKYTAVELVSSRAEVSMLLDDGLNEKLNGYGIFINELNIINWDFSEEYINAVEAKQVAEQNLIKTRTEQEQALVIANTEAQKRVIAAEAEANEIKVLAEANAESNRILTESITDLLIRYQTVAKWDGKLPTVMSGGDNMLIDIPLTSEQPGE